MERARERGYLGGYHTDPSTPRSHARNHSAQEHPRHQVHSRRRRPARARRHRLRGRTNDQDPTMRRERCEEMGLFAGDQIALGVGLLASIAHHLVRPSGETVGSVDEIVREQIPPMRSGVEVR